MLRKGELEEAEKAFQSILVAFPGNLRARDGLQQIKDTRAASPNTAKKSATSPVDADRVQQAYDNGNFDEAIDKADKMLSMDPTHAKLWNLKGAAHGKLRQLDEAIKCFEKVKDLSCFSK